MLCLTNARAKQFFAPNTYRMLRSVLYKGVKTNNNHRGYTTSDR